MSVKKIFEKPLQELTTPVDFILCLQAYRDLYVEKIVPHANFFTVGGTIRQAPTSEEINKALTYFQNFAKGYLSFFKNPEKLLAPTIINNYFTIANEMQPNVSEIDKIVITHFIKFISKMHGLDVDLQVDSIFSKEKP